MKTISYYNADVIDWQQFYEIKGRSRYFTRFSSYSRLLEYLMDEAKEGNLTKFKIYFETATIDENGNEINYKRKLMYSYDIKLINKQENKIDFKSKDIL